MAGTLSYEAIENTKPMLSDAVSFDNNTTDFKEYIIIRELCKDKSSVCLLCEKDGIQFVLKKYFRKLNDSMEKILEKISKMHSVYLAEIVEYGEADGNAYEVQKYYGDLTLDTSTDALAINIGTVIYDLNKALAELHSANIIHNDIKPGNVIISEGHCILTDYGNMTAGAGIITSYTPEYAAPEVISNRFASTSSDFFSLGVTIYEIATGNNPFKSMSQYDSMNIKNKECWIVKEALCSEISNLVSNLCMSNSNARWMYSEVSDWYEKYGSLPEINSATIQSFSETLGSITWNGKSYQRQNLSEFVSDLGSDWDKAIDFLFSGEYDKEIRMYSPEIASAIDIEMEMYTDNSKGKSLLSVLSGYEGSLRDNVFLSVIINCGIPFDGVFWRGFKGKNINELALEMLNDCFTQYFSKNYDSPGCIQRNSFAGSALSHRVLGRYHMYLSDNFAEFDKVHKMIENYEKTFLSSDTDKAAEAAFALCYKLSGSKQFPLLKTRNVDSINSLHKEVTDALNKDSQTDIAQLIAKCSQGSGFNAPFRVWISEIAPKTNQEDQTPVFII